jgi:hypothetical protein
MKKPVFFIALAFITFFALYCNAGDQTKKPFIVPAADLYPNLDFSVGYVPKSDYNALKINVSANNIWFKRYGLYSSFEKGFDSGYDANTVGITASVHKYAYLWGGFGLFYSNGIFKASDAGDLRKEFGVGIMPYKMTLIRLGWSSEVGPTICAGVKIPLNKRQDKNSK